MILMFSAPVAGCSVGHPIVGVFPGDPSDDSTPYELLALGIGSGTVTVASPDTAPGATGNPALGAALWLKADSLAPVPHGTLISAWPDSSGNGNDAANGNPATQPAYIGDGSGPMGQPGVRFSGPGVDPDLMSGGFSAIATKTIYTVTTDTGSAAGIGGIITMLPGFNGVIVSAGSSVRRMALDYHGGIVAYDFDISNRPTITTGVYSTGFTELYLDGTSRAMSLVNRGQVATAYELGRRASAARTFKGDIFEILVYDGVHSQADREFTQCYLSGKYGIAVSHAC